MSFLHELVQTTPDAKRYVVALSGGIDSVVLLHWCAKVLCRERSAECVALHINHQLSPNADQWEGFCQTLCLSLGVELHVSTVSVEPSGKGLEEAARRARYHAFQAFLMSGDVLLQGHHANDQAETVLMHISKQAAVAGLSGIPRNRSLGSAFLNRPFLGIKRSEIDRIARNFQFENIVDESNEALFYKRNWVRHIQLPVLESLYSSPFDEALAAEGSSLVDDLCDLARRASRLQTLQSRLCEHWLGASSKEIVTQLPMSLLAELSLEAQHLLVRHWFEHIAVPHPSKKIFERIWKELIPARNSACPQLVWGKIALVRSEGCLVCLPSVDLLPWNKLSAADNEEMVLSLSSEIGLSFENRRLNIYSRSSSELILEWRWGERSGRYELDVSAVKTIKLTLRQGGEPMLCRGREFSLTSFYSRCSVPQWERYAFPLLWLDDRVAWAFGLDLNAK